MHKLPNANTKGVQRGDVADVSVLRTYSQQPSAVRVRRYRARKKNATTEDSQKTVNTSNVRLYSSHYEAVRKRKYLARKRAMIKKPDEIDDTVETTNTATNVDLVSIDNTNCLHLPGLAFANNTVSQSNEKHEHLSNAATMDIEVGSDLCSDSAIKIKHKLPHANTKGVQRGDVADVFVFRTYSQQPGAVRVRRYRARKKNATTENSQKTLNTSNVRLYSSHYEAVRKRKYLARKRAMIKKPDEIDDTVETTNTSTNVDLVSIDNTNCLHLPGLAFANNTVFQSNEKHKHLSNAATMDIEVGSAITIEHKLHNANTKGVQRGDVADVSVLRTLSHQPSAVRMRRYRARKKNATTEDTQKPVNTTNVKLYSSDYEAVRKRNYLARKRAKIEKTDDLNLLYLPRLAFAKNTVSQSNENHKHLSNAATMDTEVGSDLCSDLAIKIEPQMDEFELKTIPGSEKTFEQHGHFFTDSLHQNPAASLKSEPVEMPEEAANYRNWQEGSGLVKTEEVHIKMEDDQESEIKKNEAGYEDTFEGPEIDEVFIKSEDVKAERQEELFYIENVPIKIEQLMKESDEAINDFGEMHDVAFEDYKVKIEELEIKLEDFEPNESEIPSTSHLLPKKRKVDSAEEQKEVVQLSSTAEQSRAYRQRKKLTESSSARFKKRTLYLEKFMKRKFYTNKLNEYCRICDRIWWTKDIRPIDRDIVPLLYKAGYPIMCERIEDECAFYKCCRTCYAILSKKKKISNFATVNGFVYPPIPPDLPPLNPIAERLISPRLPFMQIRKMHYFAGSQTMACQIINVPVNVNNMVTSLPRSLDDDYTVTVLIKRHILQQGAYLSGCVSLALLRRWLLHLRDTPLYKKYGVQIDDAFLDKIETFDFADENEIFHAQLESEATRQELDVVSLQKENTLTAEQLLNMQQQSIFWGEDMMLHLAPSQRSEPFGLSFDVDAEELSFPAIYYGHERQFKIDVTPYMIASSEIRRRDRRGVTPNHILYMAAKILRLRIIEAFQAMFNNRDVAKNITKESLSDPEFVNASMERNESFLKHIPNSMQYWQSRTNDLFAMISQLGRPTVFLTLSASEVHWKPLLTCLYKFRENLNDEVVIDDSIFDIMSNSAKADLVNNDPVLCCLYFDKFVDTILFALRKKKLGPFENYFVKDYFRRVDFQHRGSLHCHVFLWLENAPEEPCLNREDLTEFITLIDTVASTEECLVSSSRNLQIHSHTHTCYKKNTKKCRFGAPFWPMDKTRILLPVSPVDKDTSKVSLFETMHDALEAGTSKDFVEFIQKFDLQSFDEYLDVLRQGIHRPTVFMKRRMEDIWITPFNPCISRVLQSNMDVQFILDEDSCAVYVAEYVTKSERAFSSLHREILEIRDKHPHMDYEMYMREVGKLALDNVEMCAQEAAWYLLRLPMSEDSRKCETAGAHQPINNIKKRRKKKKTTTTFTERLLLMDT